jgi:hypothetical protein
VGERDGECAASRRDERDFAQGGGEGGEEFLCVLIWTKKGEQMRFWERSDERRTRCAL